MKKKQSLSILLLLLFSMVLGLFSISYADNYRDWTVADLKNIIYKNSMNKNPNYSNNYIDLINENETTIQNIVNDMNTYNYISICSDSNNYLYVMYTNSTTRWYLYRNQPTLNTSYGRWVKINMIKVTQSNFEYRTRSVANSEQMNDYWYVSKDVETSNSNSTIARTAGSYSPSTFFEDWAFTDDYFEIVASAYCEPNYTVENNLDIDSMYLFNRNYFNMNIASIIDKQFLKQIYLIEYYYDKNINSWKTLYINTNYTNTEIDQIDTRELLIYLEDNLKLPNTIIEIQPLTDYIEEFPITLPQYFYLTDSNTIVSGDVIDINNTFSGDYLNDYNNNINNILQSQDNEKIISAIESGNDAIISALTDDTIPSGEEPTIDDLPVVSISSGDDPSNEFFSWLMQEVVRILNDNTETTIVIPIYNESYTIRSDVFKLEIEPLRTFISAAWWFIVGVPFLKYIRRCIEKLKGGEIPASDDKNDLLGNVL